MNALSIGTPSLPILTDAPPVLGPPQGQWTLADWENLPEDDNRYEILNGVLYMSKSPSLYHQWVLLSFYEQLGVPAKQRGLGYSFLAPAGVVMPGATPVQPDFVLVIAARKDIIRDRRIFGVPDLILEVISPGSKTYDEDIKRTVCAAAGLPEYVIADLARRNLTYLHHPVNGQYTESQTITSEQTITFTCLPQIIVEVGKLFAGAPDETL